MGMLGSHISPDGTVAPMEIALKKGATIAAQAVDPEGKSLADVWVCGEPLFVQSDYFRGGIRTLFPTACSARRALSRDRLAGSFSSTTSVIWPASPT